MIKFLGLCSEVWYCSASGIGNSLFFPKLEIQETSYCYSFLVLYWKINTFKFILTHELRMRNTSYRELWENVSLDCSIRCKLYANEVRTRLPIKLLSNLNKAVLKV